MSIFPFRDSWEVWRQKVNEALGSTEPIPASNITFDNSGTEVTATNVQSAIAEVAGDVASVAGVVGDENSGLVKDVGDLQSAVEGVTDNMFENGCVNLCPITITSQTVDTGGTNVTITVNNDGTFTVNGTVTNNTQVNVTDVLSDILEGGKQYNLSGSPSDSSDETFALYISAAGGGYDEGDGFSFNLEQLSIGARVRLLLNAGQTLSNVTFKPMITLASTPNSDYAHYVPYAMSNRELTEEKIKVGTITANTSSNGNIDLLLPKSKYAVLSAVVTSTDDLCAIPCTWGSNDWGLHIISNVSPFSPLSNTSVTVTYYYIRT